MLRPYLLNLAGVSVLLVACGARTTPEFFPGLFVRKGDEIVAAPAEDVAVAKLYASFRHKGEVVNGRRVTIMTAKTHYAVGEEVRVIHVLEVVEPGQGVYVMGPKAVVDEYVDGRRVGPDEERVKVINGRVVQSPAVDYNWEITSYSFDELGVHTILWRPGSSSFASLDFAFDEPRGRAIRRKPIARGLESNVLRIEVTE